MKGCCVWALFAGGHGEAPVPKTDCNSLFGLTVAVSERKSLGPLELKIEN